MLYVSRHIDFDRYGVVDTDDDVEEIVAFGDLVNAVLLDGLSISGVTKRRKGDATVEVFQPKGTVSKLQAKMAHVNNVIVKTYSHYVTSISWNASAIRKAVLVRVSDFGTECADWLFGSMREITGRHVLTIVLDDKIKLNDVSLVTPMALHPLGKEGVGVVVDLSQVTDAMLALDAYWQLLIKRFSARSAPIDIGMLDSIEDSWERKILYPRIIQKYLDSAFENPNMSLWGYESMKHDLMSNFDKWR